MGMATLGRLMHGDAVRADRERIWKEQQAAQQDAYLKREQMRQLAADQRATANRKAANERVLQAAERREAELDLTDPRVPYHVPGGLAIEGGGLRASGFKRLADLVAPRELTPSEQLARDKWEHKLVAPRELTPSEQLARDKWEHKLANPDPPKPNLTGLAGDAGPAFGSVSPRQRWNEEEGTYDAFDSVTPGAHFDASDYPNPVQTLSAVKLRYNELARETGSRDEATMLQAVRDVVGDPAVYQQLLSDFDELVEQGGWQQNKETGDYYQDKRFAKDPIKLAEDFAAQVRADSDGTVSAKEWRLFMEKNGVTQDELAEAQKRLGLLNRASAAVQGVDADISEVLGGM